MAHHQNSLSYSQMAKAIDGESAGPLSKTYVENRLNKISQQKYQYYQGSSSIVGAPYCPNGQKNNKFASPSFISNSIFYEPGRNLGIPKDQMYKTTTGLNHSASYDKLLLHKNEQEPSLPLGWSNRRNNLNLKNMTTLDVQIGENINKLYMKNIKHRAQSAVPARRPEINIKRSASAVPVRRSANIQRKVSNTNGIKHQAHRNSRQEEVSHNQPRNSGDKHLIQKLPPKVPINQGIHLEDSQAPKDHGQVEIYSERSAPKSSRRSSKNDNLSQNMHKMNHHVQSKRGSQNSMQSNTNSKRSFDPRRRTQRDSKKGLQQSHSAFDILRNNYDIVSHHDSDVDSKDKGQDYFEQVRSGDGWACMWVNHLKREQEQLNNRLNKYEDGHNLVMHNPEIFGHDHERLSNQRKSHLRNSNLEGGDGNEFVKYMTGDPRHKVHKLKQKKRDKLKKYLLKHPLESNAYEKSILQGNGVGLNTTPDYRYYQVVEPQKKSFKHQIQHQVRSNRERRERQKQITKQEDYMNSKVYEKKMRIIERLQNANIKRQKDNLRNDMKLLLQGHSLHRSFC
ncbi:unnamed protein product [Moneuplotes crassus]|uniref:Uncharacterized protein n=3 Tax=Euplotes crassus TaxID=5936 RepID=A0AAD1UBN5_EUPCR|nr:unnamed protein product [Moneuplotes crassus]